MDLSCSAEYPCKGCIAVVGNGMAITRGQAAMALQCEHIYRANYMNSASPCAKRATHCFFHWTPDSFAGVRKRPLGEPSFAIGKAMQLGVDCPYTVFEDGYLKDRNMTWPGSSETFTRHDLREVLSPYWDPDQLIEGRNGKDAFKKPSSGLYMIGYALKHRGQRCIHIVGFNFHMRVGLGHKREHPFAEEKEVVRRLIRSENSVFFHPMVTPQPWHQQGGLLYGV